MSEQKTMRAARLKAFHQPLVVEEVPMPVPGPDEALVKVMSSGLCLTDVHIQEGIIKSVHVPYTPGHEMAGVVVQLGRNVQHKEIRIGQHVVCGIDITCGECPLCRAGRENLCLHRIRIGFERNGSHAEYAVVPYTNLFPIDEKIPFEQAAIIPDAVACMLHAIKDQGQVGKGTRVLFYGTGALGLQGVQIAKWLGAEVYASARTQAKLDKAAELGADVVINTREKDLIEALNELTCGEMCDVVFDLVGQEDTLDMLLQCIRPGGKIIALAYAVEKFFINSQETVIKEKEIIGVRGSTTENLRESIRLVEEGKVIPYISRRYQLDEINQALDDLKASKSIGRSVITFTHDPVTG